MDPIVDVRLASKYMFYMQMLTSWPISIWYKFLKKIFFQAGYSNLDLIITIPIIHAKKIYIKYEKICIFEKIHTKIIIAKTNLGLINLGFLHYSEKACPDLSRFI